ncbi:MAG: hypothetical protein ACYTEQ_27625 [Planctomycetota bacterium]
MERLYCRFLRTPDGQELKYHRVASVGASPDGHILDCYKLTTKDAKKEWDVYIDMYHPEVMTLPQVAPPGLLTLHQYAARQLKAKKKDYINLSQPTGSRFSPVVAASTNRQCFVARIVPTDTGRDIQVLSREANSWTPLGDRALALIGERQGYPFLDDMAIGPDGTLWVLAAFTRPERTLLYSYRDGNWKSEGPREGYALHSAFNWNSGLHFLGKHGPCHIFNKSKGGYQILILKDDKWESTPIQETVHSLLKDQWIWPDNISKCRNETWFVWEADRKSPNKTLKALCLKGITAEQLTGPLEIERVPSERQLQIVAVSRDGTIAVNFRYRKHSRVHFYFMRKNASFESKLGPVLNGTTEFEDMQWSPETALYAVREIGDNDIELLRLTAQSCESVAKYSQPPEQGHIFDANIYFDENGEAVVVWADWFR